MQKTQKTKSQFKGWLSVIEERIALGKVQDLPEVEKQVKGNVVNIPLYQDHQLESARNTFKAKQAAEVTTMTPAAKLPATQPAPAKGEKTDVTPPAA